MTLSPKLMAALKRAGKVVLAQVGLAALTAAWSLFQSSGKDFLDPSTLALVFAVGNPLVLAAEKWLHWFGDTAADPTPTQPAS